MTDAEILEDNGKLRRKCVVYTRVMGYHRPVESFNLGKKGEHRERAQFIEPSSCVESGLFLDDQRKVVGL